MDYSGAGGKLIHEMNQKKNSRDTVPLTSSKMNIISSGSSVERH